MPVRESRNRWKTTRRRTGPDNHLRDSYNRYIHDPTKAYLRKIGAKGRKEITGAPAQRPVPGKRLKPDRPKPNRRNKEIEMNILILAEYSGAAGGISSGILLLGVLILVYSVLCFLVPVFIYRIMRRGTETSDTLRRIEALLRYQNQLLANPNGSSPVSAALPKPIEPDSRMQSRLEGFRLSES
jgi:hypothetical protein